MTRNGELEHDRHPHGQAVQFRIAISALLQDDLFRRFASRLDLTESECRIVRSAAGGNCSLSVLSWYSDDHSDPHIEDAKHLLLGNGAELLQPVKQRRDLP